MGRDFAEEFREQAIYRINENTPRIEKCFRELSEQEIWQRPNSSSNSIGNLILHLCGNIRQYAISSLGGVGDIRERDREFSARDGQSKAELLQMLTDTVSEAIRIIKETPEAELLRNRTVQGFELSGIGIIIHIAEHYSYHTGQIAFWTKQLRDKDMGFYANIDLNRKNI